MVLLNIRYVSLQNNMEKGDERLPDWQPELETEPVGFMGLEDMSDDTP